jgi:DNA-binding FadR family transcriptional regulator
MVADRIGQMIIEAGWPLGTVLATEAQLIAQLGVSRAVVREALGLVEWRGIAARKAGKHGGLYLHATPDQAAINTLSSYIELAEFDIAEMIRVFTLLKVQVAGIVTAAMTEAMAEAIAVLRGELARSGPEVGGSALAIERLWTLLAGFSGNPILALMIGALQIGLADLTLSRAFEPAIVEAHFDRSRQTKMRMIDAMLDCDAPLVIRCIEDDFAHQLETLRRSRIGGVRPPAARAETRLPRAIALKISREIAEGGLQPGAFIGSEEDLQSRLGVGRAVLREGIRVLEAYCVVEMRRGAHGGLVVAEPDPGPTFAWIVHYLNSLQVDLASHQGVRMALEIEGAGLAAQRASADQIRQIRARLAEAEAIEDHATESAVEISGRISAAVVEASGNRFLAFIVGMTRHHSVTRFRYRRRDDLLALLADYARLAEAIERRDRSAARRIMQAHLRTAYKTLA